MVFRDGLTFNEAAETLKARNAATRTRTELYELLWRLWRVQMRRHWPDPSCDTDGRVGVDTLTLRDREERLERIRSTLFQIVDASSERNRRLLEFRFARNLPISAIAALLHEDTSVVKRQLQRLGTDLERELNAAGITASDVDEIVGHASLVLDGVIDRTA
jgi:hypothetical protein